MIDQDDDRTLMEELASATGRVPGALVAEDFAIKIPVVVKGWRCAEILKTKYSDAEANRMTDDELAAALSEYFEMLADMPVEVDTTAMYKRVAQFVESKRTPAPPIAPMAGDWPESPGVG